MQPTRQSLLRFFEPLLDSVSPPRCVVTGDMVDRQGMLSPQAWAGLDFIEKPFCVTCGLPFDFDIGAQDQVCASCLDRPPAFNTARSVLKYNDVSRDLVLGFKHGDKMHVVKAFVPWLIRSGADVLKDADFLIPVPLHRFRLLRRRYNQAAVIAQFLSKACGVTVLPMALRRVRSTPSQGHLNTHQRFKNVKRAFAVSPGMAERIAGKTLVLIDDVYTTGATVSECAKILKKAGAGAVHVLTLARVGHRGSP